MSSTIIRPLRVTSFLVITTALAVANFVAQPTRADLIGQWTFDGSLASNVDASPAGTYLELDEDLPISATSDPVFVEGPLELFGAKALSFKGPSDPESDGGKDGDFVRVHSAEGLSNVGASGNWTITGWFRIDPDPIFGTDFDNDGKAGLFINDRVPEGDGRQFGLALRERGDEYQLVFNQEGNGSNDTALRAKTDAWYFAAQVSNDDDDSMRLYLMESGTGDLEQEVVGIASLVDFEAIQEFSVGFTSCCADRLFDGAISDVRIYNNALSEDDLIALSSPPLPGDLNANYVLDAEDIDLLTQAIHEGSTDPTLDLNADNVVDLEDRTFWIRELKQTDFGDTNLDGFFGTADLIQVFQAGEYNDALVGNSRWETGDWNGDFEFDSSDIVQAFQTGSYESAAQAAAAAVPEPQSFCWVVIGFSAVVVRVLRIHRASPLRPW